VFEEGLVDPRDPFAGLLLRDLQLLEVEPDPGGEIELPVGHRPRPSRAGLLLEHQDGKPAGKFPRGEQPRGARADDDHVPHPIGQRGDLPIT
jgi:hypothetical protein